MRRLTPAGAVEFTKLLDQIREGVLTAVDYDVHIRPIAQGTRTSESLPASSVLVDPHRRFANRFDLAEYLQPIVRATGVAEPLLESGMWEWLSLIWIDQLARSKSGKLKVGERARYFVLEQRKRYRHLVLGPYEIYHLYREQPQNARCLLYTKPAQPGELVGQLGAKGKVVRAKAVVIAATKLYLNSKGLKFGAGSDGTGSPRRFNAVIEQLDRTFDLQSMTPDAFLQLLPKEFDSWKTKASIATTKR
jgi:hypothetical protein